MPRGAVLVFRDERDCDPELPLPHGAHAISSDCMRVEYLQTRASAERAAAGRAQSEWTRNLHLELAQAYEARILALL